MYSERELKEQEEKLAKMKDENRRFNSLPENKRLAEALHSKFCNGNHTDGCSWFYGSWVNPTYAHKEYLKKADKLLSKVDYATAIKVIELL